jgi:hypothetical protein
VQHPIAILVFFFFPHFFAIKILVDFNKKIANLVKLTLEKINPNLFVEKWQNFSPKKKN